MYLYQLDLRKDNIIKHIRSLKRKAEDKSSAFSAGGETRTLTPRGTRS